MARNMFLECIDGTLRLVDIIIYKSGKTVKRILNPHNGVPIDIIVIKDTPNNPKQ